MEVDKSEPWLEPGIIIPEQLGIHLFMSYFINSFHIDDAWNMKLFFAKSNFTLGIINNKFESLGLSLKISNIDIGTLYLSILKVSRNVW